MPATTQTPPPATPPQPKLLTAEEYAALPDDGRRTELVRGVIVEMPPTNFIHGIVCANVIAVLTDFAKAHGLGRVTGNDSGVVIRGETDSVRGPDAAFFSFTTLPADQVPNPYPTVAPDLVFEVRSPSDRWRALAAKAAEYLAAGVKLVAVLDPEARSLTVFTDEASPKTLSESEEFTAPGILPGFAVPVARFLE